MDENYSTVALKEKLIIAGIEEITAHGISGLSLRKVAASCGASCAAPYKYFKNKEQFLEEITLYIEDKWQLLATQIIKAVPDKKDCIARLCVANVRFNIANPLYGMTVSKNRIIARQVEDYCSANNLTDTEGRLFAIRTITGGTAALMEKGSLENCQHTFDLLRERIMAELE